MSIEEKNKEQAILEAAEQEFLEKGFEASKTTKIASRAGVTHAMLHYYYRTKEKLFDKILNNKIQLLKDSIFELLQDNGSPFPERVRTGIEIHFDFIAANPKLPRFIINELIYNPARIKLREEILRKSGRRILGKIQAEIDREAERGTIRRVSARMLMLNIASLNIFTFAALPVVRLFAMADDEDEKAFFAARKQENVEVIMRWLTEKS